MERRASPEFGDRRQELVMIGADMDHAQIHSLLDQALLDDAELALGWEQWQHLPNPFAHMDAQIEASL
jgi:Cobalamin synthesis protein cobW C-terminal domain